MHGLPYTQIWAIDFEFVAESGAQPVPVCMVAPRADLQSVDPLVAGRARPRAAVPGR